MIIRVRLLLFFGVASGRDRELLLEVHTIILRAHELVERAASRHENAVVWTGRYFAH